MIMSTFVWYVLPGMLGRTFDMKNSSVGIDIFSQEDLKNVRNISRYLTTSEYRVVTEFESASDFLDVSGQLSLKLKSGNANLDGKGSYLKEATTFNDKVDLLVKVHYETVAFTIPSSIKPRAGWKDWVKKDKGATHYIRSITYGGDLVANIRFSAKNSVDREIIKATVEGNMKASSGSFGIGLKGNLDKIKEKLRDSTSMEINYYATVPLKKIPHTIEGLTKLVEEFPEQTKSINDGLGVPLKMEVFSLSVLDRDFPKHYETLAYQDQVTGMSDQFDDVRNAKKALADWMKTIPSSIESSIESKIGEFSSKIERLNRIFNKVIGNLNLAADSGPEQFKETFDAYLGEDNLNMPDKYTREFLRLKKQVLSETASIETDLGGTFYIHWGSPECPESSQLVYKGSASATDKSVLGSSEVTCYPDDQSFYKKDDSEEEEDTDDNVDFEDLPRIQPVVFVTHKQSMEASPKRVPCARCRVPGRSTSTMIPDLQCPPGWTIAYSGVLVSTNHADIRGDTLCLNNARLKSAGDKYSEDVVELTELSPTCENLPCGHFDKTYSIPCVHCIRTHASVLSSVRFHAYIPQELQDQ